MTDSFRIKYENMINFKTEWDIRNFQISATCQYQNFCNCVNAKLTDLLMNTYFKKRPLIVMIGVTINIYGGGTPVCSKFTKNVWKISYSLS